MDPTSFDQLARALARAASPRVALATVRDRFSTTAATPLGAPAAGPRLLASHPPAAAHGRLGVSDGVTRFPSTYCDHAYNRCADQAQFAYDLASFQCRLTGNPSCETAAQAHRARDLASCAAQFVCAPNDCQLDRVVGYDARCCPGQQACAGVCRPLCPSPKLRVINDASCQCVCDPLLQECEEVFGGLQRIRDPETCQCRCLTDAEAPCQLIGGVRDPSTCQCGCLYPFEACDGRCVDLGRDLFNCGTCGTRCGPDQKCCNGVCTTLTSDQDCGDCGTNLQPPWQCCVPDGSTRGMPTLIGTATDCAGCGNVCPKPTELCCPPDGAHPTPYCDPGPSPQHCGLCGQAHACVGRELCCQLPFSPRRSYCADPITSNTDCGRCGNPCAAGRHCDGGHCVCDAGRQACGGLLPSGPVDCCDSGAGQKCCPVGAVNRCVDTTSDAHNCGDCGIVCPSGKVCVHSQCVCPAGGVACGAGCCPPAASPTKTTCCPPGVCVDLQKDRNHCGACPTACPPTSDPAKRDCCPPGVCVDLQTDPTHCGQCDTICPPASDPAKTTCCSGVCVNLQKDPHHCGQCGGRCPPVTSPTKTTCCPPGVCVDLQTDDAHCGRCDWTCGPNTTCAHGRCLCQTGGNCTWGLTYCGPPDTDCRCALDVLGRPICVHNEVCPDVSCGIGGIGCPPGQVCAHNTCCGKDPVCAVPC